MVLSLVVMRIPESFAGNLRLLLLACCLALLVPVVASAIVRLPWRLRAPLSAVFTLVLAGASLIASYDAVRAAVRAVFIECECGWLALMCCLL